MTLEQYGRKPDEQLERYSRPEDELSTKESVSIDKRERAFAAEGKFKDLLKLKIFFQKNWESFLLRAGISFDYELEVMKDPRKYAVASLGVDINKYEEVSDEELAQLVPQFLENEKEPRLKDISEFRSKLAEYQTKEGKSVMSFVDSELAECQELIKKGHWEEYTRKITEVSSYLKGMRHMVELVCGSAIEDEETGKVLKV